MTEHLAAMPTSTSLSGSGLVVLLPLSGVIRAIPLPLCRLPAAVFAISSLLFASFQKARRWDEFVFGNVLL